MANEFLKPFGARNRPANPLNPFAPPPFDRQRGGTEDTGMPSPIPARDTGPFRRLPEWQQPIQLGGRDIFDPRR